MDAPVYFFCINVKKSTGTSEIDTYSVDVLVFKSNTITGVPGMPAAIFFRPYPL